MAYIPEGEYVTTADEKHILRAQNIKVGDKLLNVDFTGRKESNTVRSCVKLRSNYTIVYTCSGGAIECCEETQFRCFDGYRPASELKSGDEIACLCSKTGATPFHSFDMMYERIAKVVTRENDPVNIYMISAEPEDSTVVMYSRYIVKAG